MNFLSKPQKNKESNDFKPNIDTIKNNLLQQKALEWLIEHAQITDENNSEVKAKDLVQNKIEDKN